MSVLVIVESYFGCTWRIGEAIATAVPDATLLRSDDAPTVVDPSVRLVILGAPTHAFTLPTDSSRTDAARRRSTGADAAHAAGFDASRRGVREWIAAAEIPATARVVTFDTAAGAWAALGRSSRKAARRLRAAGVDAKTGPSFRVTTDDVLRDGECERAAAWAGGLAD
ncbi:hypothetical protein nbrc107696_13930 [Gordonia spumicola]|uniref:Flavodoxin n=1 Tax=Gordonia spumicola TaxID=589161 RepID=A0A7I9V6N2_9ACTN|nr:flavodoxin [Gordonia spumicola]GEE00947.1 hypothetical protein nbrc107696_13930 [Gordonia spumicola]